MSDPRFARLKTDPRFRRPRKQETKVIVDDRFKNVFQHGKKASRVDKYGRTLSETHEQDTLRRFYRLEDDESTQEGPSVPDLARGEVLLESSDEEEPESVASDEDGIITLGKDHARPIRDDDNEAEIDLDEDNFADLDAQAAAYSQSHPEAEPSGGTRTCRLAVVNLDWDHVRAVHLFKIFSSYVSPTAPSISASSTSGPSTQRAPKAGASNVVRGKVLSVRVYPSEFGKQRMAREEKEGPPTYVFKKRVDDDDEVTAQNIYEVGGEEDYDEDALRKYQLERLRYYYAVVTCDTVEAASHIYSELEGTELERSANVFDLSFIPDDMTFDDDCRDEATEEPTLGYKGVDFVTDALRHSKVKLTWDEDDTERTQVTRRTLSRKEIEEADFKAYLASSTSGSEDEAEPHVSSAAVKRGKKASRDKLRALLLSGNDDHLPEGWGKAGGDDEGDVDMEITFTPGLSESKNAEDETTLEKYQRKMKEKRKKRKDELKTKVVDGQAGGDGGEEADDFFAVASDGDDIEDAQDKRKAKKNRKLASRRTDDASAAHRPVSTPEELALLVASDAPDAEPKHFNLKSVLKAEKQGKGKKKRKVTKGAATGEDQELQEDFVINVRDERFTALHEDHTFAIDPSNPHFKKTKSMAALLDERSKRQRHHHSEGLESVPTPVRPGEGAKSLEKLVESVKRKSVAEKQGNGKRRKL